MKYLDDLKKKKYSEFLDAVFTLSPDELETLFDDPIPAGDLWEELESLSGVGGDLPVGDVLGDSLTLANTTKGQMVAFRVLNVLSEKEKINLIYRS